jgi:hypothetical protein
VRERGGKFYLKPKESEYADGKNPKVLENAQKLKDEIIERIEKPWKI